MKALQARSAARAADIGPTIAELQAAGATSLREIAAGLNARGIPTARGNGSWSAVQVARVLSGCQRRPPVKTRARVYWDGHCRFVRAHAES
jgi:hypothetical protein